MPKQKKIETAIPFSGFYESIHSSIIDLRFDDDRGDFMQAEWDKMTDKDWKKLHADYTRTYTAHFAKLLGIKLNYETMQSPREYNFTTDRIFAFIERKDLDRIRKAIDRDAMSALVAARFTSRPGFSSFYSNDLTEWENQPEPWDHNQIETLLECYAVQLDPEWEETLYEYMSGNF